MLKLLLQIIAPIRCLCCAKNAVLCCEAHLWEPGVEIIQGVPVHNAFPLDDLRLSVLTAFKDSGVTALAKVLGVVARRSLEKLELDETIIIVIPPVNKSNYRKRGYHPVALVAKQLGPAQTHGTTARGEPIRRIRLAGPGWQTGSCF